MITSKISLPVDESAVWEIRCSGDSLRRVDSSSLFHALQFHNIKGLIGKLLHKTEHGSPISSSNLTLMTFKRA